MGIRVKKSTIPKAGEGLFAAADFGKEVDVCDYRGKIMTEAEVDRKYPTMDTASYVLKLGKDRYVDATKPTSCFGRYACSTTGSGKKPNCRYKTSYRYPNMAKITATRKVKKGEEFLASYGGRNGWYVPHT
jgi:hypothetical protein